MQEVSNLAKGTLSSSRYKETFTLMFLCSPVDSSEHRICQVNTNIYGKPKIEIRS